MKVGSLDFGNMLKTIINIFFIVVQLILLAFVIFRVWEVWDYVYIFAELIGIAMILNIIYKPGKITFKLSWVLFILIVPICGILFYFLWGTTRISKKTEVYINNINKRTENLLKQNNEIINEIEDLQAKNNINMLFKTSGFPVYKNTKSIYLKLGEELFEALKNELSKAEKFIFIEFFIISKGRMQEEIMECLYAKAAEGVEIRIIYDQVGSLKILPPNFQEDCNKHGIQCFAFNPFSFSVYGYLNYRDHRKIVVIDGNVGFTGGINIGDEYINDYPKHGHWKDNAVMLKGDAVWSFTVLFLKMWDIITKSESNFEIYRPTLSFNEENGYVVPFGDGPTNHYNPAELNYRRIISTAEKYVYIYTPYLVIDSDMISALCLSAKSGVDVRIVTPFIPDKMFVHEETRSFYEELLNSGVKIFEYSPGFVHAKSIVSDDKFCFIGSVNFDFRSLIWNYECGVFMYNTECVYKLKEDFIKTMEISVEIDYEKWKTQSFSKKMWRAFLRIVSPLV